jgi:hypothetical protein
LRSRDFIEHLRGADFAFPRRIARSLQKQSQGGVWCAEPAPEANGLAEGSGSFLHLALMHQTDAHVVSGERKIAVIPERATKRGERIVEMGVWHEAHALSIGIVGYSGFSCCIAVTETVLIDVAGIQAEYFEKQLHRLTVVECGQGEVAFDLNRGSV